MQKIKVPDGFILTGAAFLVRILYAIPGILDPEKLMRFDSWTYLAPARSLAAGLGYLGESGTATALRVPLYPLCLASVVRLGLPAAVVLNCFLSSLAVLFLYYAARELGLSRKTGWIVSILLMFSPTALALSPMFLSDGPFMSLVTLQMWLFLRFVRRGENRKDLLFCAAAAGAGTLLRPLNLLWVVPLFFIVLWNGRKQWKKTALSVLAGVGLFCLIVVPWILRNHAVGFGYRIDAVSADSLKHNAVAVLCRVTGENGEKLRQYFDRKFEADFAADPERFRTPDDRLSYQEKVLSGVLKQYPLVYLGSFFSPLNFVPDIPNFLQNLGLSDSNTGTWDVVQSHGLIRGALHYCRGRWTGMILTVPLSLLLLVTYLLAAGGFWIAVRRRAPLLLTMFLLFFVYYIGVTGAVAYPRFSLPVLPYLILLAGVWMERKRISSGTGASSGTSVPEKAHSAEK